VRWRYIQDGTISLGSLGLEQLQQLKQNAQQEVEFLTQSLAQLHSAIDRLQSSRSCATEYAAVSNNTAVLVPLTSSIFVHGEVEAKSSLLVDIGTGYFAEREPQLAAEYFSRRVTAVKEQIEKANHALSQKRQHLEAITAVHQRKVALTVQQQSQPKSTS